jgi:hypothetical protein
LERAKQSSRTENARTSGSTKKIKKILKIICSIQKFVVPLRAVWVKIAVMQQDVAIQIVAVTIYRTINE